jgi:iron-sulfur cluster assembly protein
MNKLLSITSNAADQIKKLMSTAPKGMDSVVIGVDKSGCSGYSYKLDFGNSSDFKNYEVIEQDGARVLIDPKATMFLLGSTMDYQTDKLASRFVFNNPNEKSTCGCGESFSI